MLRLHAERLKKSKKFVLKIVFFVCYFVQDLADKWRNSKNFKYIEKK